MKNMIKIWILVVALSFGYNKIYSQNSCKAELEFLNNSASKNAGESGTYYRMRLVNKSERQNFNIDVENSFAKKQLNMRSINNESIELTSSITSDKKNKLRVKSGINNKTTASKKNYKKSNQVSLDRNEEFIFYVRLAVPKGARFGSVNKSLITVTSDNCEDFKISKEITTKIIDGE